MTDNKTAPLAVLLSGALWGVISVFIRHLSACGIDAMQISLVRMAFSALIFTLFLLIFDRSKLKIHFRDIPLFIGTGIVSVVLFNTCYFYTMLRSQASVAVVLLYTSPVFIMIMSALFFREKITRRKLSAVVLTVAGCAFVSGIIGGAAKITPFVFLTGLGAGFFYALYTIFGKLALRKYEPLTVTAYTFIFGFIGSLFMGKPLATTRAAAANPKLLLWFAGIALVSTVLPYILYTYGVSRMEPGKAAILVADEPLVGALIGMIFYREEHSLWKIAGIALIFAAIVLLNLPEKNKPVA